MKFRVFACAAALALASASSATAVGAPESAPTRLMNLTPCQIDEYHRCFARYSDHGFCLEQAQTYTC